MKLRKIAAVALLAIGLIAPTGCSHPETVTITFNQLYVRGFKYLDDGTKLVYFDEGAVWNSTKEVAYGTKVEDFEDFFGEIHLGRTCFHYGGYCGEQLTPMYTEFAEIVAWDDGLDTPYRFKKDTTLYYGYYIGETLIED